ncbi:hypothetical protein AGMMS49992_11520 [Clostridia bacterium]|nr:hypothetical protein AGMMS49992_11520 [Clostridia bacterium]
MNRTCFMSGGTVFEHLECIQGYAFNAAIVGEKSALLSVRCADYAAEGEKSAHFYRVGCRSPRKVITV